MREIVLEHVSKTYKSRTAVKGMSVTITDGIYGLLGENGAGKTTLMRMLCGILKPSDGEIYCDGIPIHMLGGAYRRRLGYLPQDFGYYENFTAERFLEYMAALKNLPEGDTGERISELLQMVGLYEERKLKLKAFSGGMIRRIGIAQALLNDPEILVLDEPTAGLDPKERVRFRNIISSLGKNRIILLSTHIVSDVAYIADEIMLMRGGELIEKGTEKEFVERTKAGVWNCVVEEEKAQQLNEAFIVSNLKNTGDKVELRIVAKECPVPDACRAELTLEDAYLYHMQGGQEENQVTV